MVNQSQVPGEGIEKVSSSAIEFSRESLFMISVYLLY
jgi:hypothetical protein